VKTLDGIRVIDFTRLLPGAYATLLLADLGAEVIKIEDPRGGDTMRAMPVASGSEGAFNRLNRGKRSVTLDLRSAAARDVVDALAAAADVAVDSFRPTTARRLGVDAETLRSRHPRLVCASIIGFDRRGPLAEAAAHDINYQALAGLLRPPASPGPLISDIGAAMRAAVEILAALVERQRTGVGRAIDVTLLAAAEAWTLFPDTNDFASPCYALYETADGEWVALGALEPKFWRAFCDAVDRPDFIAGQHARGADANRLRAEVAAVMRTRTRDEWLARFKGVDACLTPVARRTPPTDENDPTAFAPALGADTDAVLEAAGIGTARRSELRRAGVI
jgi:crotonobetainyl-CoA:carnitine CoA-transferase CaiB-like acyl-CoA transferase